MPRRVSCPPLRSLLCVGLLALLVCATAAPLHAQARRGVTISGMVTDAETGQPLPGANVFIANSMLGAATDAEGAFILPWVPLGSHELIVSMLGYEEQVRELRLDEPENRTFTFALAPRVYQSQGIEVAAYSEKDRQRLLEKFERFFLGISRNAKQCRILNPAVLTFDEDQEHQVFVARADGPLLIENRALGYRLRFVLQEFRVREDRNNRLIKYSGKVGFSELAPDGKREQRRWEDRREHAYEGSLRHFLTALATNRLWEEGFMLLSEEESNADAYVGVPGNRPAARVNEVKPDQIMVGGSLDFERRLDFTGYMKVVYFNEMPEAEYYEFRDYAPGKRLRRDEDHQVSWISLTSGPVNFTTDGQVQHQYGLTKLGYWYFERVAEMIPQEYYPPEMDVAMASPQVAYLDGRKAYAEGRYADAVEHLTSVATTLPLFALDGQPTAAHLLGMAYDAQGHFQEAHDAWLRGLSATEQGAPLDPALANAYVRSVFAHTDEDDFEPATWAYLNLLEHLDANLDDDDRALILKHFAQAVFVLPPDARDALLTEDPGPRYQNLKPASDAGTALARWWRRQDPLPATPYNERVGEHLQRVQTAQDNFGDNDLLGFDDRGKVLVQYGSPRTRTIIPLDLRGVQRVLSQYTLPLPGPMISPPNEFWAYRHIDDELLHFVFALTNGRYQISDPDELIPEGLRSIYKRRAKTNQTGTDRDLQGDVYALALMEAWKSLYSSLALHHPVYEEQLTELEHIEAEMRASAPTMANSSIGSSDLSTGFGISPKALVNAASSKFDGIAHLADVRRRENVVSAYSNLLEGVEPLPVPIRAARFLNDDGTTRTEVYWSHIPGTLQLSKTLNKTVQDEVGQIPDRYLIELTVNEHDPDYEIANTTRLQYWASDLPEGAGAPVQTLDVPGTTGTRHLSFQWDQFAATMDEGDGQITRNAFLRTGAQRVDEVPPLSNEPGRLEMSDLKPVYLGDDEAILFALGDDTGVPPAYPFTVITPDTPVGLYFEVYNLTFGTDDQTRYAVEYEVIRDREARDEKRTSATTRNGGTTRRANEYISLDLTEFGRRGTLDVVVRVRDEVTGQTAERLLTFILAPSR